MSLLTVFDIKNKSQSFLIRFSIYERIMTRFARGPDPDFFLEFWIRLVRNRLRSIRTRIRSIRTQIRSVRYQIRSIRNRIRSIRNRIR